MSEPGKLLHGMVFALFKTDEFRIALRGEWYLAGTNVVKCEATSTTKDVPILFCRPITEDSIAHKGDPCEFCNAAKTERTGERCSIRTEQLGVVWLEGKDESD